MLLDANIPKSTPLIFGEGIISTDSYEFAITFTPEMDELFFTRRNPGEDNKIYTMQLTDGKWSSPKPAFFTASEGWDFEPHISPKGGKLYFGSTRPLPDSLKSNGLNQWYSKKTENGWTIFSTDEPIGIIEMKKDKNDNMLGLTMSNGRTRNVWFKSVKF